MPSSSSSSIWHLLSLFYGLQLFTGYREEILLYCMELIIREPFYFEPNEQLCHDCTAWVLAPPIVQSFKLYMDKEVIGV